MVAALAMGADGIWCGSIWLGTDKSELTPEMKARIFAARSEEAIQSRAITSKPYSLLRSKLTEAFDSPNAPKTLPMPLQTLSVFEARARIERARASDFLTHPVGQIVGDMHEETTVKEIFYNLLSEFLESTERLGALVKSLE